MKTIIGLVVKVIGGLSLLVSLPALAHHSFAAAYDENRPINMQGVVTRVELTNPHSWLWVDVTGEDGTVTNWGFEGGPPVNLFRNGLTKDTLPVGSEIRVFAYQAKSGENKGCGGVLRVSRRSQDIHGRLGTRRRRQSATEHALIPLGSPGRIRAGRMGTWRERTGRRLVR